MAAPVNATINVLANTDQAVAQFRSLQAQVASLNKTVSATSGAAVAQQAALNRALVDGANASRMWSARVVPMNTAVGQFSDALDKGRMSLGQYTRHAASQLPGMSRVFRREFDMMSRVAETNVRRMQTQYIALGNSATGAAQAMAFTPTALNKQAAATEIAAQRQMMMNRMIDLGTTKLLNWGKNTQWAGRQLMVGFSIPLAMMGAAAAKAFKEIDQGTISFKRVYGDLQTTTAEMERNLDAVKDLGVEYTRYGKSLASTIELSAKVAATGARNEGLVAATEQTIRLATLGLMEYDEALEATIALQTAFQVSNEDLSGTIDFLNVVENETILTMQDMAAAIPRVAPVVKGLGGDVKDLAVFMTALREGGVSAEQGANALKSGLGRLINPTKAAREEAEKYGISIEQIVQRNRGDLMGTVTEFGKALNTLGDLEQQQVLQKVFGTYQYARLGALFRNIANDAGQAQRTMELTSMSVEDLAKISERELSKIEEATSVKFQASIEKLKIAIAPIGETFMKALMPVIDTVSKILNAFNDLPDGVKNAIAIAVGAIAGVGPIVLMTVGLIANGIANIGKLVQTIRKFFARLKGDARLFDYLTVQEQEAAAAANGLSGATENLTGKFLGQQKALERLIQLVGTYAKAVGSTAAAMPLGMGRGQIIPPRATVYGKGGIKMAKGGVVPGTGNKDTVPAMLTPGESVITKEATQKYGPMIQAMNAGTIPGFNNGVVSLMQQSQSTKMEQFQSQKALVAGHLGGGMMISVKEELARVQANIGAFSSSYVEQLRRMDASGQQFVRVYTNLVALMSQELNEDIKNGNANIARVKAEIGNPAAQVELKRQLKLLGMQDDEITQVVNRYVANLNAQLDAAEKRLGSGNLSATQMDRALKRAAVGAAGKTFTDPAQRAMFAKLATAPTTFLSDEGKGRRTMQSRSAAAKSPEMRSYVNLRKTKAYGISAATKFPASDIAAAGYSPQVLRQVFKNMELAAQQAIIATKGNFQKALPIFIENGLKAGESYNDGLVSAISKGKPNVSQAVSKNRQAASPAPWAAPMGKQDGGAYGKGFSTAAATEAAKIKQSILGMSGGKPGLLPNAQQALAQGTRVKPQGFPASAYNPSNNPQGLGIPRAAIPMGTTFGVLESREGKLRRQQSEERRLQQEQEKFKVTDKRREGAVREQIPVIGQQTSWIEKSIQSQQLLEKQKQLNLVATEQATQAQLKANGALQRQAVAAAVANQVPARGGILDRPLGALRRFAFPQGQGSSLRNAGFDPYAGRVQSAGKMIVDSAKEIKSRVITTMKVFPSQFKATTQQLLIDAKRAGTALQGDFVTLGRMIKTNMQVDLKTLTTPIVSTASAIKGLGTSAATAAQKMVNGIGNFMTAVDKNGTSRMQKMGQASNGAIMGLMGISMAASFMQGSVGEMAQKIMPVTMGLMGLQMILPMLTNPIGLAIIATTALVAGFIYLRKQLDDTAKEAANMGANIGGVANGLKVIEDATGFKPPTLEDRLFRFSKEDRESMAEFSSYFESEAGSKFIEELNNVTSEERYRRISFLLAQGIATGLEPEKAEAFGKAIAEATGDAFLASNITSDFKRGVFGTGSQALIDLSQSRFESAPQMGVVARNRELRSGESLWDQQRRTGRQAFQSLNLFQQAVDGLLGGMSALGGIMRGRGTQDLFMPFTEGKKAEELVAESAKGLGFAIQMLQDIANAEAVLAEERRSGAVAYEEAEEREKEIDSLREKTEEYYRSVIENGADSGAMLQAFGDQLSFQNFSEDQIKRVTNTFSPDALAQRFFKADYSKLDESQKEYVDEVFSKTMSGLTPDNVGQRLQDIEGRWSEIAQEVVDAIRRGADVDFGAAFTEASFQEALQDRGLGIDRTALSEERSAAKTREEGLRRERAAIEQQIRLNEANRETLTDPDEIMDSWAEYDALLIKLTQNTEDLNEATLKQRDLTLEMNAVDPTKTMSENLTKSEEELEKLGITTKEVAARLLEFSDDEFIKQLGQTEGGFIRLGQAIKYLGDTDLNLENVMKYIEENPAERSAQGISQAMQEIKNIKLDEGVFGKTAYLNVNTLTQGLIDLGIEVKDMAPTVDKQVKESANNIKKLGKDVKNEFGNIPLNVDTVVTLFGTDEETAAGLSGALEKAFPKGISPIEVPLLLTILNADMLSALAGMSPEFLEFAKTAQAGDVYRTSGMTGSFAAAGRVVTELDIDTAKAVGAVQDLGFSAGTTEKPRDLDGTNGSGGTKEDPLKEFRQSIMERINLYTNIEQLAKKLGSKKKAIEKALGKIRYGGSFVDQLRQMNISEQLITELLSKGYENAKEIVKRLGVQGLQGLDVTNLVGMAAQSTSEAVGAARTAQTQTKAAQFLRGRGINDEQVLENIAGDPDKAAELLALVTNVKNGVKGAEGALNEFINAQIRSVEAAKALEAAISGVDPAIQQARDAQQEYYDQQMAMFDQQYANIEMVAHAEFKARTGMTVPAMELQIKKNEDLIDKHREEIQAINDSIRAIETKTSTSSNYAEWGLEQLEKEIRANEENIRKLERINELAQRRMDDLRRQDELRNRESEAISKDLEKLTDSENKIRESYDKRIQALDKVSKINDHIINQQKQQLDISRAISEGDVYAATQAAQEMRASSGRFAGEQLRTGLETGMESEIANLRTAGGLTREQAEAQIANIKEQSYQTSLLIRNIEDEIYNRQVNEILPLRNKEYELNLGLQSVQNSIAAKQLEIRDIERSKIEPLQKQNDLYTEQIDDLLLDIETEQMNVKNAAGQTKDEVEMTNGWITANLLQMEQSTRETNRAAAAAHGLAGQWVQVGDAINAAKEALTKEYNRIDLKPLSPDYTEEQRQAEKDAAYAVYEAAISQALGKIPSIDPSQFFGSGTQRSSGQVSQKIPSQNSRWIMMPGMNMMTGQALDEGIIYMDKNGRFRWTKTNKLVPTMPEGDLSKYYSGGFVLGEGARDSISAMLTPGEYVIRKAMVDKYGTPLMNALNQGSFNMPTYNTGPEVPEVGAINNNNISNINAPVYNTYDMKFSISGTSQSADEIANKVMFKIKQVQGQGVRSNRGF